MLYKKQKFNIGDRVIVCKPSDTEMAPGWSSREMDKFDKTIQVIKSVYHIETEDCFYYYFEGCEYSFHESWLVLTQQNVLKEPYSYLEDSKTSEVKPTVEEQSLGVNYIDGKIDFISHICSIKSDRIFLVIDAVEPSGSHRIYTIPLCNIRSVMSYNPLKMELSNVR